MNIFLDDIRLPGDIYSYSLKNWVIVRHPEDFLNIVVGLAPYINTVSMDHDLGPDRLTGYDCLLLIAGKTHDELMEFDHIEWLVHTSNPVGRDNMNAVIERYL